MSRAYVWLGAIVAVAACGGGEDAPRVAIATNLAVPKGVLDRVTKLTLTVLEGSVSCDDASTGQTSLPDGEGAAKEIARRELTPGSCAAGGGKFCGDLTIQKSDAVRVFSAVAKGDGDATLAIGCKASKVDQDALPIAIKMFRYLEPPNCGDGNVQPTEQCEPAGGALCDADCLTKEILLSIGSGQNGTDTGVANDKQNPFLLWPTQSGTPGRFFAFYTDKALSNGNIDVSLRAMADDMSPLTSPPALAAGSVFLPNGPTFPPPPSPREQSMPQAAFLGGKYYVVFQDNDTPGPTNGQDIRLRSMDSALVAEQGATPVGINGANGAGEPAIQAAPTIAAGPQNRLFIAWEDAAGGKIVGRTLTPPATLGAQNDISIGTGNKGVSVAATSNGWVAVWQSGTGVKLRAISDAGTPSGSEQTVNDGGSVTERPRVASLPDGRFAVTWSSGGDIFVQRYDAKGAKLPGDQASPINDVVKDGDQITPAIGATPAAGGSYVVAWLDAGTSDVRARMLGGTSGFLFNNENGQSTEFKASRAASRTRANPAVAAGGREPFVAIAWEDKTNATGAGIVARRFPLPSE